MRLLDVCEPLFLYMCRLNRATRKGGHLEYRQVRAEIEALFADMQTRASSEPGMLAEYEKVEEPLIFFVDSLIAESDLPLASEWNSNRMAFERNERSGDEKFFDHLDETIAEPGEAADERLAVLYTCLGLGFRGFYFGQPEVLRAKMNECAVRLRKMIGGDEGTALCGQAYDHTDTRDLVERPGARVGYIALGAGCFVVLVLVINGFVYHRSNSDLRDLVERIIGEGDVAEQGEESSS